MICNIYLEGSKEEWDVLDTVGYRDGDEIRGLYLVMRRKRQRSAGSLPVSLAAMASMLPGNAYWCWFMG